MMTFTDAEFEARLERETGIRPPWVAQTFADLEQHLRQSIALLRASPFIPRKHSIRGFVYDVHTGRLREVR